MKKYNIEINRDQLETINLALDVFSRLAIGQIHNAIEDTWGIFLYNNKTDFESYNKHRQEIHYKSLELAKVISKGEFDGWSGSFGINSDRINPRAVTAYNIQQVLRNQLWKEREIKSEHSVDSTVCITNGEEPIKINKKEN